VRRAATFIPVLLRFPPQAARQESWGRLLELTSGGAELVTAVRLLRGEGVFLSFELGGERFDDVRARVEHAETDQDGHRLAVLRLTDAVQRRRLAKVLLDVISRS